MRLFSTLCLLCLAGAVTAQEFRVPSVDNSRANKWDLSFNLIGLESESTSGPDGAGAKIDSEVGWGFGFAYNLNKNFALGFDFSFVEPRYNATLVDEDGDVTNVSTRLTASTGQFKGIWNILDGPITPFVEAGLGWTYLDSNITSGPPVTGCWWDPWWGYICSTYWNTYSDTSFSYGGGLGLRWDVTSSFFLKASYDLLKVDLGSSAGDLNLNNWKIDIGTSF